VTGAPADRRTDARVLVGVESGVMTLTLNRPEKKNAIDIRMIGELKAAIETADLDASVKIVALRGAGKDFCAGLDLNELLESADLKPEQNEQRAWDLGEVFVRLRKLPKVTVAVVEGRCLAGGCGLATSCDLVLASSGAQFGYPEINRGFVPAMVMTMLRRLVGEKVAFDLAATGRVVDATEAQRLGLISRVIPAESFESGAGEALKTMAALSASALALTKQQFYQLDGLGFEDGIRLGAKVNAVSRATPDFRAAIAQFLKK
jgi:methylglutaconyl-CoA hydratase